MERQQPESTTCARCNQPGAGSNYKGQVFHLSCKMEAKLDAGELGETPVAGERKTRKPLARKKTGAARFKTTFGGPRT